MHAAAARLRRRCVWGTAGDYFLRLDFFAAFLATDFRAAFFAVFFAPLLFAGILALL